MVPNKFSDKITAFQSDRGCEFLNDKFQALFYASRIHHRISCLHTPEHNGDAEWKHWHFSNVTHSLLFQANLPPQFWLEALHMDVYHGNRSHTPTLHKKSPFESLFGKPPDFQKFWIFGYLCYPNMSSISAHKLTPCRLPCILLGFFPNCKGFRCFHPPTNKILLSCYVTFLEIVFPSLPSNIEKSLNWPHIPMYSSFPSHAHSTPPPISHASHN